MCRRKLLSIIFMKRKVPWWRICIALAITNAVCNLCLHLFIHSRTVWEASRQVWRILTNFFGRKFWFFWCHLNISSCFVNEKARKKKRGERYPWRSETNKRRWVWTQWIYRRRVIDESARYRYHSLLLLCLIALFNLLADFTQTRSSLLCHSRVFDEIA